MPHFAPCCLPLDVTYRWLRGHHHGHSTVSDGDVPPLDEVRAYEAAGYDYLALSEHDVLLPVSELQPHTRMCIEPAVEVTSDRRQSLMYRGADQAPPQGLSALDIL